MKKFITSLLVVAVQFSVAQQIDYKGLPEWSWHQQDSTEYYLYAPSHLQPGKKYPVVLVMHGCCGADYHATLRNTVDPIVRMWHNFGANTQSILTYIVAPATSRGWQQHFSALKKVLDDLVAHHDADPQRVYVTGFSMGGDGAFRIIQQYPHYFAAAITMGMRFRGDSTLVKDIPIWSNQGETDYFSRALRKNIADIRHLNGALRDTGGTWITGVNPRYSNFKGYDHGVMWVAASTQPLTDWAYSKINDGNVYPVVFFDAPSYKRVVQRGQQVPVIVNAHDPDGTIQKVEIYHNHHHVRTLTKVPFAISLKATAGDNLITAVAFDNKGKSSEANTIVKVDIAPSFITRNLADARLAAYYSTKIEAKGNGAIIFTLDSGSVLPTGLQLYPDGTLKGVPAETGPRSFTIVATDEDGQSTNGRYDLRVLPKETDAVLITHAVTSNGKMYRTAVVQTGEAPFFNSADSVLSPATEEINFSDARLYTGLSFIQTDANDANQSSDDFLHFEIDEDATVYVAYETLDSNFHSTVPAWLGTFTKEQGQIVAQYRYFNVYGKAFPKGSVVLPGADAKENGVSSNYFVMVKKSPFAR
jgi:dienelactone hydrolase